MAERLVPFTTGVKAEKKNGSLMFTVATPPGVWVNLGSVFGEPDARKAAQDYWRDCINICYNSCPLHKEGKHPRCLALHVDDNGLDRFAILDPYFEEELDVDAILKLAACKPKF